MTAWLDAVVDLSHWQTPVDFAKMKSAGFLAVMLKATQGSGFIDKTFTMRAIQAAAAGLLVGAYHFADASDAASQTSLFLNVAGQMRVLALDIEHNSVLGGTVSISQAAQMVSNIQSATGRVPLCYIGRYGPDGKGTGLPNNVLSRCPLWLPEYGTDPVPPPGWSAPILWQWTSSGACAGVGSPCDRNRFSGTADGLASFWSGMLA